MCSAPYISSINVFGVTVCLIDLWPCVTSIWLSWSVSRLFWLSAIPGCSVWLGIVISFVSLSMTLISFWGSFSSWCLYRLIIFPCSVITSYDLGIVSLTNLTSSPHCSSHLTSRRGSHHYFPSDMLWIEVWFMSTSAGERPCSSGDAQQFRIAR